MESRSAKSTVKPFGVDVTYYSPVSHHWRKDGISPNSIQQNAKNLHQLPNVKQTEVQKIAMLANDYLEDFKE